MKKERIVSYSMDQIMKMKGRTIENPPPGPPLPKDFWENAYLVERCGVKKQLTLRIDPDIVDWFKARGKGYQTLMNNVLRSYMDAH